MEMAVDNISNGRHDGLIGAKEERAGGGTQYAVETFRHTLFAWSIWHSVCKRDYICSTEIGVHKCG